MRIKFLSVIVSFLIVSFAVSSCLNSDDDYEYSSDATLKAFVLDTVHGVNYTFTIDQLNRLIYNRDSLPVGSDTIIDRILIKTMSVTGWITSGSPNDTLFSTADSVDLTPAMNNDAGMQFKVHAADGLTTREYKLKVNVHLQDPDSLVWTDMQKIGSVFSNTVNPGEQKVVILGNELLVYTSNTTVYKTSAKPGEYGWSQASVVNLPSDAKLTSAVSYKDALYMVTESKKVFTSTNGTNWTDVTTLGDNVITLISGFSDRLSGIVEIGGKQYFNICDGKNWEPAQKEDNIILDEVPNGFPTENISSTVATTGNGIEKVVLTGMPQADEKMTIPWFSLDGKGWASLENTAYDTYCPGMTNPFIMYYGEMYYCFGGKLDAIYSSVASLAWFKTEKNFLLPQEFKDKGSYSVVVDPTVNPEDKRDFIWVIFGGNGTKNEVWRGRLNKLGFEIQ
ncbi:DUF6242 domain-containing protein [Bacteroides sp. GD17]|jgi:hypothetical protein|uniref:DUF6242 domain-containing protein n=1 Tax=Bacteroides sp. GD17 TaxID=3139826 RepID=UPI0025EA9640|nr:DUF6242 domain-containing protein [uncultured Bacteroides sp.]